MQEMLNADWVLVNGMGEEVVDMATRAGSCLQLFVVSRELRSFLLSMQLGIWREKTCLLLQLQGLEEDSLGRQRWKSYQNFPKYSQ